MERFQVPEPWQAKAKKLAQKYAAAPSGWFVVSGASGAGKTHLCTAICRRILEDGRAVRYELWRESSRKIRAAAMDSEAREKLVSPLKTAEVLYLDDFLKTAHGAAPTRADIELAFDIIGAKYNAKALTLLSTEFTVDELLSLDEALGGRIYEASGNGARYLSFTGGGKNWRLRSTRARSDAKKEPPPEA